MSRISNRVIGVGLLCLFLCLVGFNDLRAVRGNQQSATVSSSTAFVSEQNVQKQEKTIADLTAELEALRKVVETKSQESLNRDVQLKGWVDAHKEKFNTDEERFRRAFGRIDNQDRILSTQNQGLTNHERRLAAIENYLRKRP